MDGDVLDALVSAGMDADEAKAYSALVAEGPLRASALAERIGTSRGKAYRLLGALEQRSFVTVSLHRPARYTAAPPAAVLEALEARAATRLRRVRGASERALRLLQDLPGRDGAEGASWSVVRGRRNVIDVARGCITRARTEVLALSGSPLEVAAVPLAGEVAREVARKTEEGVAVRAVVNAVPELGADHARWAREHGAEVRACAFHDDVHFVVVDRRQVVLWIATEGAEGAEGEDVAVWSDAPSVVAAQALLFDAMWRRAGPPGDTREPLGAKG